MIVKFSKRYCYCLYKLKVINIDIIKCMYTYLNIDNRIVYIHISGNIIDVYPYHRYYIIFMMNNIYSE